VGQDKGFFLALYPAVSIAKASDQDNNDPED